MKKPVLVALSVLIVLVLAGCSAPVSAEVLKSDKDRISNPQIGDGVMAQLVDGNNQFAFDLYQVLQLENQNLFYSPYSISMALAMTYAGARGDTGLEMAQALKYFLAQNSLHPAFNALDQELAQRGEGAQGKDGEGFRLNIVNAIWGQKDYQFLESYLDLLAENYGAGLRVLDFMNHSEASRETINTWVSEQTEGRIEDLIPEGGINEFTRLVLTNAIYFNAAWQNTFNQDNTQPALFYLADGTTVSVPMMQQTANFGYAVSGKYLAVELPYDGNELSMIAITAAEPNLADLQSDLNWQVVEDLTSRIEYRQVKLSMPKFEFESEYGLKETLMMLGMQQAFTDQADLSGMSGIKDLVINDVVHKAFISVDEAGTEAAAATGVIVGTVSIPVAPVEVNLDSPFFFMIKDKATGAILFAGRLANPGS